MKNIEGNARLQYFMVLGGSMIGLCCGFISSIAATHIIQPIDFGFYKAFIVALQLFTTLSHLGLHYTYGRQFAKANTYQERLNLNSSGIVIFSCISLFVFIVTFIVSIISKTFFGSPLPNYVLFASCFAFVLLFQYFLQQRLQGENKMVKYTVLTLIPQFLLASFFTIMLFFNINLTSFWIILVYILFNSVTLFFLFEHGFKRNIKNNVKSIISINFSYGFHLYVGSIFAVTTSQLLSLLIASTSGLEEYALYSLGLSFAAPMTFIASTLGIVQFKKNIYAKRIERKEIITTLIISGLANVFYYIFLNYIMLHLIGNEYTGAIKYANILLVFYTMMGLGDYFNKFVSAKGNGVRLRNSAIFSGGMLISSAAILIPMYNINGLIAAQIIGAAAYLIGMIISYQKTVI